jgi:4-amino-4-deoxy-L-arabinose transferase-like glycosyltransferase
MKPVRLPAAATIALPRWSIIALCMLYILPGVIGLDPWKGEDAAGFGIMWTMAHGGLNDWLWPHIVGLPMSEEGPLAFWLGAICIKLLGWLLSDPLAARISTVLCFALGASSVWYATYSLGRRNEAQPLKLAFGGQPTPQDFGRTLADGALLIYIGCLGLLLRSHETSAEALQIALIALSINLCVQLFDNPQKRRAALLGLVLGLLMLTRGWVLPAAILFFLCILSRYRRQRVYGLLLGIALPIAGAVSAIWLVPIALYQPFGGSPYHAWMNWNLHQIGWPSANNLIYFFRYTPWFAWPAWPFAAWAIFAWRKQERSLHIALPFAFLLCFVVLALLNPNKEESLFLPLLPPLAILAAFGLPTIKRSTINAIDWFSLMVFTGIAAIIWFGWIAEMSGWPAATAKRILSWAPGYQPDFQFPSFVIALLFTAAWFGLVYWRISRQPAVLWRAVVLSSGGVILSWLLLLTLWLPLINQRITYAPVAAELSNQLNVPYTCINSNVGPSQRASFAYFGGLHFATLNQKNCEWYLAQTARRTKIPSPYLVQKLSKESWELIWQGHRAADKDELFSLYRKK